MARKISSIFVSLALDPSNFSKNLKTLERRLGRTAKRLSSTGRDLTSGITLPLAAAGGAAFKFSADFEDSLTKSTSIMGELSDAMRDDLSSAAKEVATTSRFSASQAADAYFFLASAGLDAAQSIAALPQVTKFATAGNFDLARATDLATDAQSALGLTVKDAAQNLGNLTRVTDVLVKANTLANASAEQFSESLTNQAGAALRQVNKDIEEGVAVLAAYADQGVKGAEAGTKLFQVLRDLQKSALGNERAFKSLNIEVFDSLGEFRNIADVIGDFERALDGMSTAQTRAALSTLGLQEKSIGALIALIGFSDKIREYEKELRKAGGTTDEVANKQLSSLAARFDLLTSQAQNVAISLGEALAPSFRRLFDSIESGLKTFDGLVKAFRKLPESTQSTIVAIGALAALIGPTTIALGVMTRVVIGLTASLRVLFAAMVANPIGIVVTALTAAGAAALTLDRQFTQMTPRVRSLADELRGLVQAGAQLGKFDSLKFAERLNDPALKAFIEDVRKLQDIPQRRPTEIESFFESIGGGVQGLRDASVALGQLGAQNQVMLDLVATLGRLGDQRTLGVLDEFGLLQQQIAATESAIISLSEANVSVADPAMQQLAATLSRLREEQGLLFEDIDKFEEQAQNLAIGLNSILGSVAEVGRGLGDSLGDALVHGESFSKGLADSMKNLAADFISSLIQMGIRLIAFTALSILLGKKEALSKAFTNSALVFGNVFKSVTEVVPFPLNLILAPILAGAAAAVTFAGATAFAEGGLVFGPTLGLVGEAGPEVIMPLDRLDDFLPGRDSGGNSVRLVAGTRVLQEWTFSQIPRQVDISLGNRGFF